MLRQRSGWEPRGTSAAETVVQWVVVAVAFQVAKWIWSHPANEDHRVRSMGRALVFQARGRLLKRPSRAKIGRRGVLLADLHSYGASKAVYANPPDWPEMLVWKQLLSPGDLFIDVGANVGTYSLWAGDLGAEVLAIEPGPSAIERLRRNIGLNDFAITVIEAAATNRSGTVRIDPTQDTIAHVGTGEYEARAVTLDSIIGGRLVTGVKIDVEGAERLVLEGAREALGDQRIRCLQLEWNSASVEYYGEQRSLVADLLDEFGYRLYRPADDGSLQPTTPETGPDVFALPG